MELRRKKVGAFCTDLVTAVSAAVTARATLLCLIHERPQSSEQDQWHDSTDLAESRIQWLPLKTSQSTFDFTRIQRTQ